MSMPSITARLARAALAAVGATLLAGCAGLAALGAVTAPVDLYLLTPKSTYDPDLPQVTAQIVVGEPTAASSVNTDRIAVKPNAYQLQYFPDARWVDRAPLMVQSRLVESFENTGRVTSVGRQAIGLNADFSLISELREFQAEMGADPDAPLTVQVRLNIKIVKEPQGVIFASESFASQAETVSDDLGDVVAAFDEALGRTMKEAVQWTVRQIAEFTDRRGPGVSAAGF
ncbi:MAG TPA: ABC-type transport auxiliary lipoprotein family protein [Thermohalobaculum sp.]|nr:ABC-type transport auxiliary lipoprotein family protein [Thermohalobaculum sp.]